MSMTEREKAARAIGYLEGMSSVMWSLDRSDSPVQVCTEAAAFYDEQIEALRKVLFENESEGECEIVRCRDCKNFEPDGEPSEVYPNSYWCDKLTVYMPPDGFCSFGKRKVVGE